MSAFVIKIIASISMLIDHIGVVFPTLDVVMILRRIGRIAFPVYAYFIAQGCKYTRNINKYMLRLGLFALISEIPYDLAFFPSSGSPPFSVDYLSNTNVFFTLFLGVASINIYERIISLSKPKLARPDTSIAEVNVAETGTAEVGVEEVSVAETGTAEVGVEEVSVAESSVVESSVAETGVREADIAGAGIAELDVRKSDIAEPDAEPNVQDAPAPTKTAVPLYIKLVALAAAFPVLLLGNVLDVDYGMYGVIYILFFYLMNTQNKIRRAIAAAIIVLIEYGYPFFYGLFLDYGIALLTLPGKEMFVRESLGAFWWAFAAVPLIYFYNGKQGPKLGLAFYLYYPVHIAALGAILYIFDVL